MVVIRMARAGRTKRPVYTLVAADKRAPRDGAFLEKLGQYDPHGEDNLKNIKTERIQYWVSQGAQISESISSLFKKHKVNLTTSEV